MSTATLPEQPQQKPSTQPQEVPIASISRRNLISVITLVEFIAFFLPWVTIFGANLSGIDVQKISDTYKLAWLMPILAAGSLALNLAGQNTDVVRRLAGFVPIGVLGYALYQNGNDLFKVISWGGWLALIAGLILIFIPDGKKQEAKA